ncbi:MAG: anti-sigma-F factor Fin family protein [Alicyclobacillus sp.]|nr:anti-sigma-F factor Fin family protein [Alicyclobacillus sp.]
MRVEYVCRHCQLQVGALNQPSWTLEDARHYCGLNMLSPVEWSESVTYYGDSGVLYVQTVCDYCQRALEAHPELLVEGKLLQ